MRSVFVPSLAAIVLCTTASYAQGTPVWRCAAPPPTPPGFVVTRISDARLPAPDPASPTERRLLTLEKGTSTRFAAGQQGYVLSCKGERLAVGGVRVDAVQETAASAVLDGSLPPENLKGAWVALYVGSDSIPFLRYAGTPPDAAWTPRNVLEYSAADGRIRLTFRRGELLPGDRVMILGKLGTALQETVVASVRADEATALVRLSLDDFRASAYASRVVVTLPAKKCTIPSSSSLPTLPLDPKVWSLTEISKAYPNGDGGASNWTFEAMNGASQGLIPGVPLAVVVVKPNGALELVPEVGTLGVAEAGSSGAIVRGTASASFRGVPQALRIAYRPAVCR